MGFSSHVVQQIFPVSKMGLQSDIIKSQIQMQFAPLSIWKYDSR